ncbi:MAG: TRAP transporter large permease subunit [Pseudomonadales bacterium]|nr:TRAP transporter large permease subunit [Pseudomonadales bacterium]
MSNDAVSESGASKILPSLCILSLLIFVIFATTAENFHSQLLKSGVKIWPNYGILRTDIPTPSCDPNLDIGSQLVILEAASKASAEDDLFAEEFNREATSRSLANQKDLCKEKHLVAEKNQSQVTSAVKIYRSIETSVAKLVLFSLNSQRIILALLIFGGGMITTYRVHHLAFRAVETARDYRTSTVAQLGSNIFCTLSTLTYLKSVQAANVEMPNIEIIYMIIIGFGSIALLNIYQLFKMPAKYDKEGGSISHALLTVPLFVYMVIGSGSYFIISENHLAAVAIYFSQVFEFAGIPVSVALYIWVGILLKQTRIGELVFNVFKPWKLPPELLAFVAILIMAVPTAYTGGSGIIVLAMGVVVYEELRRVGTRRQLALAATAMSGSSGVVLRPCILVLLIAMLNKEVTTDELYGWGIKVFLLTLATFFFYAFITKKDPLKIASPSEALGPMGQALKLLFPYVATIGFVVITYAFLLDAYIDEFTAPIILPVLLVAVIIYERTKGLKNYAFENDERASDVKGALGMSINEAVVHIGAILFVIAGGLAAGGGIERSGIYDNVPELFSNIWVAMSFIVVLLVIIGMTMDAMAAVIMITGTLAAIAYRNGIDPIHFWMTVLVALELGFLTPPVALNHIMVRQVVGEKEAALAALEGDTFYYRHEKILLPLLVMGTAVLIVAFGPLIVGYSN